MPGPPDTFVHRFEAGGRAGAPTLLLLHGTGGNEHDLLPLGDYVAPGWARLSPRGRVLERGMPRFFRRIREGVFDLDDLRAQTAALAGFVGEAAAHHGFDPRRVVAVGYSNGANIAASLLLLAPGTLAGAVLFHPQVPIVPDAVPALDGVGALITAGRHDPIVPPQEATRLAGMLREYGAAVDEFWHEGGHGLVQGELDAGRDWLRGFDRGAPA